MKKKYNVAVVGATGNTGRNVLSILQERAFPLSSVNAIASMRSKGKMISFGEDKLLTVCDIDSFDFSNIDICFMCAGNSVSQKYADKICDNGCVIIDKTSYFRLINDIPLIVPEVNARILERGANGIISAPNCIAGPLSVILNAMNNVTRIKRVVISTYQSVSGAGKQAMDELYNQTKQAYFDTSSKSMIFKKSIAFNVIPEIGVRLKSGDTDEEYKIKREIGKIFDNSIKVAVTSVRVPVFIGHGMSVACEFHENFDIKRIIRNLKKSSGVKFIDDTDTIITPIDAQNEDDIFVSRLRVDDSVENGVMLWCATDNLRKGAALNSVQIAEFLISIDSSLSLFKRNSKK